jgi:hypothetical protein
VRGVPSAVDLRGVTRNLVEASVERL